jgi:hypothetical protein
MEAAVAGARDDVFAREKKVEVGPTVRQTLI